MLIFVLFCQKLGKYLTPHPHNDNIIMAVPFSNTKLRVPQGFQTLLEMLSREILRDQPQNIYEYSATYLEGLVKQRGNFFLNN